MLVVDTDHERQAPAPTLDLPFVRVEGRLL